MRMSVQPGLYTNHSQLHAKKERKKKAFNRPQATEEREHGSHLKSWKWEKGKKKQKTWQHCEAKQTSVCLYTLYMLSTNTEATAACFIWCCLRKTERTENTLLLLLYLQSAQSFNCLQLKLTLFLLHLNLAIWIKIVSFPDRACTSLHVHVLHVL